MSINFSLLISFDLQMPSPTICWLDVPIVKVWLFRHIEDVVWLGVLFVVFGHLMGFCECSVAYFPVLQNTKRTFSNVRETSRNWLRSRKPFSDPDIRTLTYITTTETRISPIYRIFPCQLLVQYEQNSENAPLLLCPH